MTEYWDLTDAEGRPTGETFRRGADDWPRERFHVVATVCLVRSSGEVLVTRRSATKSLPLTWEFPGGSATSGETSLEGARRELREETCVEVPSSDLTLVGRHTEGHSLVDLYVALAPPDTHVTVDLVEVADHRWLPLDEARRLLTGGEILTPWPDRLDTLWPTLVTEVAAHSLSYPPTRP